MRTRSRPAFTLFQLLVILALLVILLALFLPAVARLREAAARAQSQNNLKQIAIACHNYFSTLNVLPPGVDAKHYSAVTHLLPYIEQNAVFNKIDFKKPMEDKTNAEVRNLTIKVFLNPMDPVERPNSEWGAINYLMSAGSRADLANNDGVFYLDSKVKFQDIADGTSNTLLAVETLKGDGGTKAVDLKRQHVRLKAEDLKEIKPEAGVQDWKDNKHIAGDRCASWMDGRFLQGTFSATRTINDDKPDVDCGGAGGLSGPRSVNDRVNAALCDGSVRAISKKVSADVWKALATRAGGEVVNQNDF